MTDRHAELAKLRDPFPASQIGKLPKGGVTLDYVGHGAVRSRLLDVDPEWNWEPCATVDNRPAFELDDRGRPCGLWIRLTVCGVTRLGFGSCQPGQFDAEKVLIGDALRNAAMSFGVALDLWVRGHAEDDEQVTSQDTRQGPARGGHGHARRQGPPACVLCGQPALEDIRRTDDGYAHVACIQTSGDPSGTASSPTPAAPEQPVTSVPGSPDGDGRDGEGMTPQPSLPLTTTGKARS